MLSLPGTVSKLTTSSAYAGSASFAVPLILIYWPVLKTFSFYHSQTLKL